MEVQDDGKIKATFKDFKKLFEKEKDCKIYKITQIGEAVLIQYKRGDMYHLEYYPSHLLQMV